MVDGFLRKMKDAIVGNDQEVDQDAEYEQGVRSRDQDPYSEPAGYGQYGDVSPASEDPYGDPGNNEAAGYGADYGQFGDVRPASEDPYGDPGIYEPTGGYGADSGEFGDVSPASEDPYGDPADQENGY